MPLEPRKTRVIQLYANAIFVKLLLIIGAYYGGTYLDARLGTKPFILLTMLTIAFGLGFWWVIVIANKAGKS